MLRTGEKQIHNGADDNASGTAALIELARILKNAKQKNNNYLFIAFSAEELGLNGSKYFIEHSTIDFSKVNYMINMDMVGRLNDSSNTVTIGGYGTSPQWSSLINIQIKRIHLQFGLIAVVQDQVIILLSIVKTFLFYFSLLVYIRIIINQVMILIK
jgi:Zn-dependent M28 family amino/carboxypeptidase